MSLAISKILSSRSRRSGARKADHRRPILESLEDRVVLSDIVPLCVPIPQPTICTTPCPTSITLSNNSPPVLTDSATLCQGNNPTGTITFNLYAPNGTTVVDTEKVTVSGDGKYTTPTGYTLPTTGTVSGTYQWVASYSGDCRNQPASGNKGDEPVVVKSASPSISTAASPASVTLGGGGSPTLKDTATLAGGYHETGTISFSLYAPNGTTVVDTEMVSINGDGTYTTPTGYTLPASGTVVGTYQWVASYSGDSNNKSVASAKGDEPVQIGPSAPAISTASDPTQVAVGTLPFNDSATLSKGYRPTGTITFTLYAPGGTTVVYTDHVPVNGDGVYSTTTGDHPGGYVPTIAGTYQWVASYTGDGNNNAAAGNLGDEPVIATPEIAIVTTTANPSSIALTNTASPTLRDSATLSGGFNPTGEITFALYAPGGTTVVDTETVSVSGNGTYSTPSGYTLPTAVAVTGTYQWVASYSGDSNNDPASSTKGDEPVTVESANPTIGTTASPSGVTLDGHGSPTLEDSATLSGGYHETGTITFTLYAPAGGVVDTETLNVNGDGTYATPTGYTLPASGTVAGTYQWVASYSGDSNNGATTSTKGDEPVAVAKAGPAIGTTADPSSVALDNTGSPLLKDSTTLAGGYHETGAITFTLYAPGGGVVDTETVSVNGDSTYATPHGYTLPSTGAVAGTYQWVASYSGDANNGAMSSTKGDEPVAVTQASTSISTTADPSGVTLGASGPPTLKDTATLAGGYHEVGTLTFRLYAPDGTTVVDTETVNVSGNGTYATPHGYTLPAIGTVTGTYQWVVSYAGDSNNNRAVTNMGDEPVAIASARPAISTAAAPTQEVVGAAALQDGATLSGGYNPTGTITFTLYASDHTTALYSEKVAAKGDGTFSTVTGWVPTAAGTYYWVASYSGDGNNIKIASGASDEPVTVNLGTSTVTTVIMDTNHVATSSPYVQVVEGTSARLGASRAVKRRAAHRQPQAAVGQTAGVIVLDTAKLTVTPAAFTPTGTATYTFTGTNGTSLAGLTAPAGWTVSADRLTWTETVAVSGGAVPDSDPTAALPPGFYLFAAQYSGDAHYQGSTSIPEPLVVQRPPGPAQGAGGVIERAHPACSKVRSDLQTRSGESLISVRAPVSRGTIQRGVSPVHLSYFVQVFAPSSSFQIDVSQTPTSPLPALAVANWPITFHDASTNRLTIIPRRSVTITPTDVKINVSGLTPGADYILGIKYNTKPLVGKSWPLGSNATVYDTFKTTTSMGGLVPISTVNLPIHDSPARAPRNPSLIDRAINLLR